MNCQNGFLPSDFVLLPLLGMAIPSPGLDLVLSFCGTAYRLLEEHSCFSPGLLDVVAGSDATHMGKFLILVAQSRSHKTDLFYSRVICWEEDGGHITSPVR